MEVKNVSRAAPKMVCFRRIARGNCKFRPAAAAGSKDLCAFGGSNALTRGDSSNKWGWVSRLNGGGKAFREPLRHEAARKRLHGPSWCRGTLPNAARRWGVRQWGRRWPQHGKTVGCANEAGVGRNTARRRGAPMGPALAATRPKEIAQGNALGTTPPNQSSPERAKRGPLPRLMFRIRDAVFPQPRPGFLSANIFRKQAGPASRFFVVAGCEDLGGGLRYEIAPFQGWARLWGFFPGRCPGLSHGAPLGR